MKNVRAVFVAALVLLATVGIAQPAFAADTEFCANNSPDGTLNLRRSPSERNGSNILATIYNGECGIFIGPKPARSGVFVRARIGSIKGWVKSKWIARAPWYGAAPAPARRPAAPAPPVERDWRYFATSAGSTLEYDDSSLALEGSNVSAWVRASGSDTLSSGIEYESYVGTWIVNCARWTISSGPTVYYDGSGRVVRSFEGWSAPSQIIPDTIAEALAKVLCGR